MLAIDDVRRAARVPAVATAMCLAQTGCMLFGYDSWSPGDAGSRPVYPTPDASGPDVQPFDAARPGAVMDGGATSADAWSPAPSDGGGVDVEPADAGTRATWLSDNAAVQTCPAGSYCGTLCVDAELECLLDCADNDSCDAQCWPQTRCLVECLQTQVCQLLCREDSQCALDCGHAGGEAAQDCSATCAAGARCHVSCAGSGSCAATCKAGSSCAIDCRGADRCDAVVCEPGAACLLYCPGGDCAWQSCSDASLCLDGSVACGRECPDREDWSWSDFSTHWGAP